MDEAESKHLIVMNKALAGEPEPSLGIGFHAGFIAATAIWCSYVSKMLTATPQPEGQERVRTRE